MKAVVPALFPVRSVNLQLDVSGDAEAGDYIVAALAYTEDGLRIGHRRMSWEEHSSRLAVPAQPLPALSREPVRVALEISFSTPPSTVQFEIIDWRSQVGKRAITVHQCAWFARSATPGLHASGILAGKEWQ
ncbi:hypothetical protein ASD62_11735 [Phycicoccus sp. Root563]|nr:hypothetical protein ASD62_11735 [Phycicoccus sp. Root563]